MQFEIVFCFKIEKKEKKVWICICIYEPAKFSVYDSVFGYEIILISDLVSAMEKKACAYLVKNTCRYSVET